MPGTSILKTAYYHLKPVIPRDVQLKLRRVLAARKRIANVDIWPVFEPARKPPPGWSGWPDGKKFALVLTHDVEFAAGQDKCRELMTLEKELGFRSSFNFVPERYEVDPRLRALLLESGFEVGVHGLYHDGKLFSSESAFKERAERINHYLQQWHATGFRAPAMHHDLAWMGRYLNIDYDLSTFDTDPFEPQSDGAGTIFPFLVSNNGTDRSYVELPYTLPQDHGLFIILREKNTDIWKHKLQWIAEMGGMALLNTHPDYINFGHSELGKEEFPVDYYVDFLQSIKNDFEGKYWHALPSEVASFYRSRGQSADAIQ
jgi:hypothetical protein